MRQNPYDRPWDMAVETAFPQPSPINLSRRILADEILLGGTKPS
jgi:hypothetical protein